MAIEDKDSALSEELFAIILDVIASSATDDDSSLAEKITKAVVEHISTLEA